MTELQAAEFVQAEIGPRCYKPLNAVQMSDWIAVVMLVEEHQARQITKDLARDPAAKFTMKAFAARVTEARPREKKAGRLIPRYDPYVRCLEAPPEHPDWEDREWLRTEQFSRSNQADKGYVTEYANAMAAELQEREGGRWCGVIRQVDEDRPTIRDSRAADDALDHIINGPAGPARDFALRIQDRRQQPLLAVLAGALRTVPPAEGLKVVSCTMIDALQESARQCREPGEEG